MMRRLHNAWELFDPNIATPLYDGRTDKYDYYYIPPFSYDLVTAENAKDYWSKGETVKIRHSYITNWLAHNQP